MNLLTTILVAPFMLVIFVSVRHALQVSPLARNSLFLAGAVTLLCLQGVLRLGGFLNQTLSGYRPGRGELIDVLLLPYAALGVSILLALLLAAFARFIGQDSTRLSNKGKKDGEQWTKDKRDDKSYDNEMLPSYFKGR